MANSFGPKLGGGSLPHNSLSIDQQLQALTLILEFIQDYQEETFYDPKTIAKAQTFLRSLEVE
jgi:uncharacterized protein with HEPN domain